MNLRYYKTTKNNIIYKEGASFLDASLDGGTLNEEGKNKTWEDFVTAGQSWSYGAEFLIQRKIGKFTGWIGYTLSWTQLQFDKDLFSYKIIIFALKPSYE